MMVVIYWTTKATPNVMEKIRKHFEIPSYMRVSRETEAKIKPDQIDKLREIEQLGYIQIREYDTT